MRRPKPSKWRTCGRFGHSRDHSRARLGGGDRPGTAGRPQMSAYGPSRQRRAVPSATARGVTGSAAAPSAAPSVEPTPSSGPSSSAASAEPDHGAVISVLQCFPKTQELRCPESDHLNDAGYAGTSAANADANWTDTTSTVFYGQWRPPQKDIASSWALMTPFVSRADSAILTW